MTSIDSVLRRKKSQNFLKKLAKDFLRTRSYSSASEISQNFHTALGRVEPHLSRFEWLYGRLADDPSRDILVKVLTFRALGYRRVKLPLNTPAYWDVLKELEQLANHLIAFPQIIRIFGFTLWISTSSTFQ